MASPYDILIEIQARAQEVTAAAAQIADLTAKATAAGPALTQSMQAASAATQAVATAGQQAGAATTAGMTQAASAASNAAANIKKVGDAADEAGKHAGGLREMFEQAFAFGIGNQIVDRLLEIPERLIGAFEGAIHEGVEFNAEMETLGIGIAGSLRQADPDKYLNFQQAATASTQALDLIRQKANQLGLDLASVAETYQVNVRAMVEGGVTSMTDQINLVLLLSQAAASKGLSGFQAQRDIIDLLNGKGDRTIFSKELGVTDDDIKQATNAGNLYGFLAEKLSAYAEAGDAAASTFGAASQRLSNQVQQLEGVITKPLFDVLKVGANELAAEISSPEFQRSFGVLSEQLATGATVTVSLGLKLVELIPTIVEATEVVGALTLALGTGALITALGGAVTTAGSFAAALTPIAGRITAMLTAMGPAGLIIGAATTALLLLDHALDDYVAKARELLSMVQQFASARDLLMQQIGNADTPEKKTAAYAALDAAYTSIIEKIAKMKQFGSGTDPKELEAAENERRALEALRAEFDRLAGARAKAATSSAQADKFGGLAKEVTDTEEQQREAALSKQQSAQEAQANFDTARLAAAKAFHLESTATYADIQRAADGLLEQQRQAAAQPADHVDTTAMEAQVNTLQRQLVTIQGAIHDAQAKVEVTKMGGGGSNLTPETVDPNYNVNVRTAEDLTGKLKLAMDALSDANEQNSQSQRTNTSATRESNSAAAAQLEAYKDLQFWQQKITDTGKAASVERIQQQQAVVRDQLDQAKLAAGPNNITPEVQQLEIETKELALQKQYLQEFGQLDQKHLDLAHQIAVAEVTNTNNKKATLQATRDEHAEEIASDRDRKTALMDIRDRLQEIQSNPSLTTDQKQQGELPLLQAELALIAQNIAERQRLIALYANDPKHAQDVARMQQENVQDQHTANQAGQQIQGMSFAGQMQQQAVALQNQWGTTSHAIATSITSSIGTAVDGLANALDGLIMGTKTWQQALTQVGDSIIQMLIRIVLQQTVGRAAVYAVNEAFGTAETAASSAQATSAASAWSTAAVLASVATYGSAAAAGVAALGAAVASGAAISAAGAAVGSYEEGGLIPGRPSHKDNRIAHVATGEYIVKTAAVQHYGAAFFHALNNMRVERTGFAAGGLVGPGDGYVPIIATSNPNVAVRGHQVTLIQTRDRSEMLQALQSSEGRKIVLGHVTSNRTKIGIPS